MNRIIIFTFLPLFLFVFAGCYDMVPLTKEHYKDVGGYQRVSVLTDSAGTVSRYTFDRGMCVIQRDTLIGPGTVLSGFGEQKAVVAIPVSTISYIEVQKLNYFVTATLCAGVIGVALVSLLSTESPAVSKGSSPSAPNSH